MTSRFPIPVSFQDLERDPYGLAPYPADFDAEDEATRAESFSSLVVCLEQGNRILNGSDLSLFDDEEDDDSWMDNARMQALYTLVR
jgi:hypothetical protein